jgi:hypothetical protein
MPKTILLTLCLTMSGLTACNSGNNEASSGQHDDLLNSQRAPLDKAHEVEQMIQDRQRQLDQRIQDQTQ